MATVCYINVYNITHDRGVNMGRSLSRQFEVPEMELVMGQELPHFGN